MASEGWFWRALASEGLFCLLEDLLLQCWERAPAWLSRPGGNLVGRCTQPAEQPGQWEACSGEGLRV